MRIARQTQEIYAPLAERLGIWQIKWELEDLAFKVLEPETYRELASQLETRRRAREAYVERAMASCARRSGTAGIEAELSGRPKHIYSASTKKMQRKGAEFGEIYDVHAIRVLVEERQGLLRRPRRGPLAVAADPRPVRRLHRDAQGEQVPEPAHRGRRPSTASRSRSRSGPTQMHRGREVGIAAHWRYKEGSRGRPATTTRSSPGCASSWSGSARSADATEFVEGLKLDIFQDQVFVFTPKGDVKDLPAGAGPLDFAYRIHTDVGHRCIGAKVNNRLVPLDYRLQNGDIVEIVTTKAAHGPSRDWLKIVRTSHAREKIRQWFKRQERDENIAHGKRGARP